MACQGGVDGHAGGHRKQRTQLCHSVRRRAQAHIPVGGRVAGPFRDRPGVQPVRRGAGGGDDGAVSGAGKSASIRSELLTPLRTDPRH